MKERLFWGYVGVLAITGLAIFSLTRTHHTGTPDAGAVQDGGGIAFNTMSEPVDGFEIGQATRHLRRNTIIQDRYVSVAGWDKKGKWWQDPSYSCEDVARVMVEAMESQGEYYSERIYGKEQVEKWKTERREREAKP